MIVLGAADTLRAGAADANVVTYTVYGRTRTSTADAYDVLAQGQLSGSTATIYTAPASTEVLISSIHWCNSSAATTTTFNVFINGTAAANQVAKNLSIASGTTIVMDSGGWHIFPEATSSGGGDVATDAIWDAKGDLAVGSGANTADNLPVGTDDQILMADSSVATFGLKWVSPATPVAVGTANSAGTSDDFARGAHVHAHETAHVAHDTIWAAAGDLVYATANDTATILGIGSSGKFLTSSGSAPQWSTVTLSWTQSRDLDIGAAVLPTSNAPSIFAYTGSDGDAKRGLVASFGSSTDAHLWFKLRLPDNYSSGGSIILLWRANATTNSAVWGAQIGAVTPADADTPSEHAMGAASTTTTATNATEANRLNTTTVSPNTDSMAAGDLVWIHIYRDADNASDSLTTSAELEIASLTFTAAATVGLS